MTTLYRTGAPIIGDRVSVRFRTDGGLTEAIGTVLATDPLTLRVPAREEDVVVTEPLALRRLSPRLVRNSQIRHVEMAHARAFPGIEHAWTSDGQWLMRAGDGITERSNSATPLGPSAALSAVPLAEIEAFYARHHLPLCLHLPERLGRAAQRLLDDQWHLSPEIIVMTRDLPARRAQPLPPNLSIDRHPDDDWLRLYHFRGQPLPADALEFLHRDIDGHMGFARLRDPDGTATIATTRATLTCSDDDRRWLGFSAVEVAAEWRRRGLARTLCQAVLDWGVTHGATGAYLHVIGTNTGAIRLYESLGFTEHHRGRYATRGGDEAATTHHQPTGLLTGPGTLDACASPPGT